jgi:hypothetical protein
MMFACAGLKIPRPSLGMRVRPPSSSTNFPSQISGSAALMGADPTPDHKLADSDLPCFSLFQVQGGFTSSADPPEAIGFASARPCDTQRDRQRRIEAGLLTATHRVTASMHHVPESPFGRCSLPAWECAVPESPGVDRSWPRDGTPASQYSVDGGSWCSMHRFRGEAKMHSSSNGKHFC